MLHRHVSYLRSHRHVPPADVAPRTVSRGMLRRSQCNGPRVPCRTQADRYGWFGSYFGRGFDAVVASELRSLQRVRPRTPEASIGNFHPPRDCSGCRAHSRLRSSACDRRHAPRRGCAACPHAPGSIQQRAACDAPQHGLSRRYSCTTCPRASTQTSRRCGALRSRPTSPPLRSPPTRPHAHAARA